LSRLKILLFGFYHVKKGIIYLIKLFALLWLIAGGDNSSQRSAVAPVGLQMVYVTPTSAETTARTQPGIRITDVQYYIACSILNNSPAAYYVFVF